MISALSRRCFVFLLAGGLMACSSLSQKVLQAPNITAVGIKTGDMSLTEQHFTLTLTLQNPNDIPIPLTKLGAEFLINGLSMAQGQTQQSVTLPRHGEAKIQLDVVSQLSNLLPQVKKWLKNPGQGLPYSVKGNAFVPLKSGGLPFEYKGLWKPDLRF